MDWTPITALSHSLSVPAIADASQLPWRSASACQRRLPSDDSDKDFKRLWGRQNDCGRRENTLDVFMAKSGKRLDDYGGENDGNSVVSELKRGHCECGCRGSLYGRRMVRRRRGQALQWILLRGSGPMRELVLSGIVRSKAVVTTQTQRAVSDDLCRARGELGRVALAPPNASLQYDYRSDLGTPYLTRRRPRESRTA